MLCRCALVPRVSTPPPPPRLGIVFRGTGKRISKDERSSWHESVDVFFQENAWVDTRVVVEWVTKTLKPATAPETIRVTLREDIFARRYFRGRYFREKYFRESRLLKLRISRKIFSRIKDRKSISRKIFSRN